MNDAMTALRNDRYFVMIKNLIEQVFGNRVNIILFGSRARGVHEENSDYDICIRYDEGGVNGSRIAVVRDLLENSNIPYKIDIIDYNMASDLLKELIMKEGIQWKN